MRSKALWDTLAILALFVGFALFLVLTGGGG